MADGTKDITPIDDSIKDLSIKRVDELIDKDNKFLQIFTRAADPNTNSLVEFHAIDEKALAKIAKDMPEINRACRVFGRQNSQATGKLMSLSMIAQSPYRRLKQCLAKIERKRGALKENIFKLRREKVELNKLLRKKNKIAEKIKSVPEGQDYYEEEIGDRVVAVDLEDLFSDLELVQIDIEEKVANISDTNIYTEGALKEIGMYQDAYKEIMETYDIPENWDEADFERTEVEEHVKTAFLHAVRDVQMTGRLNVGTCEYLEQFGVSPAIAFKHVQIYLQEVDGSVMLNEKGELSSTSDIDHLYDFLDKMYLKYGKEYKKSAARIGLKDYISEDFLYKDKNREKDRESEEQFYKDIIDELVDDK